MRFFSLFTCLTLLLFAGMPKTGSTTCPTSGNKQVNSTSAKALMYVIQAPSANTGSVCIGGSDVTTSNSPCLAAGQTMSGNPAGNAYVYDLSVIYFACTANTDTVRWSYQ